MDSDSDESSEAEVISPAMQRKRARDSERRKQHRVEQARFAEEQTRLAKVAEKKQQRKRYREQRTAEQLAASWQIVAEKREQRKANSRTVPLAPSRPAGSQLRHAAEKGVAWFFLTIGSGFYLKSNKKRMIIANRSEFTIDETNPFPKITPIV